MRFVRGVWIRRPKKGFRWRTSWRGTSGDKQEESSSQKFRRRQGRVPQGQQIKSRE